MSNMTSTIIKDISTQSGESDFQVRFLKHEGVGLLTTKNNLNYLVLDSLEYWYDLIQDAYPPRKKCSCKNDWFKIAYHYTIRNNSNDIKRVDIYTTCTNCNKTAKALSLDIDYSPTVKLLSEPISFCETPKLRYRYKELTGFWRQDDLKKVFDFMFNILNCKGYGLYHKPPEFKRAFKEFNYNDILKFICKSEFLEFYFSFQKMDVMDFVNTEIQDKEGVVLKLDNWRKNEVIRLSSITILNSDNLNNKNELFYLTYCTQYIEKGHIINKSLAFEEATNRLELWLKENFIQTRGKNCFDSIDKFK